MGTGKRIISIVTPCYNEEANVNECYDTIKRLFEEKLPAYDFEYIFCDNASLDRTPELLRALAAKDSRVKVILNSRNFGPFCNMFNGVRNASGDAVITFLPADLQDPPDVIPEFVKHWENGYEVAYGVRKNRQEGALMRATRWLYYRVVNRFSDFTIPPDVGEFQLVDRKVIAALRQFEDYYPYLRGMIASCGFKAIGVPYNWLARKRGLSKNRLYHLIDQGLNGIISFSRVPLRLSLLFGFILASISVVYAIVSLVLNLVYYRAIAAPGIPTLIVGLFFFSGVQFVLLGLLGEYICAIHSQVRKRPLVVERERLNF